MGWTGAFVGYLCGGTLASDAISDDGSYANRSNLMSNRVLGHRPLRRCAETLLAVRPVAAIGVRVGRLWCLAAVRRHIVAGFNSVCVQSIEISVNLLYERFKCERCKVHLLLYGALVHCADWLL